MLLSKFLSYFTNAPKWAHVNVESVENYGLTYVITTEETVQDAASIIDGLKHDLDAVQKETDKLEEDLREEGQKNDDLEKRIEELWVQLDDYKISPTDTLKGLIERYEALEETLKTYKESNRGLFNNNSDLRKQIKKLRAKKDKATVKRCLTTGQLSATFDGVEYQLIKK